jgi:CBS domain-containing protein
VTDRDFRNRVLAEGLDAGTLVSAVASRPLRTVPAAAQIHEAWTELLDTGGHHLPVERDGEIIGVLTASDLLECSASGPVAVLRAVEQLGAREQLHGYAGRVAEMAAALLAGGLDAAFVAGFVARLNDALLLRLVRWAEADLGRAPVAWAWLALGAEGRMEQTLLTDQDNALAYEDGGEAHREWFQAFADRIGRDLEAAGFPPCPGGRMARRWHQTVSAWTEEIERCIAERPARAGLYYDLRHAVGPLDIRPLLDALDRGARTRLLVRTLAREALSHEPPQTLLLRLRGESSVVDLKRQGVLPIVLLARCYAMEAGSPARNTLDRLDAARDAGLMAPGLHGEIEEAYRFVAGLRLRVQLRMLSEHRPVTDEVRLSELSAVERGRLKDAFRVVRAWQEKAAYHHQTGVV